MDSPNEHLITDDEDICVTLDMEDGTQEECEILTIFEVDGQDYIVLLPKDKEDLEESPVYIYRYFEDEDGSPSLENILSDEEYEAVAEQFDAMLDELEE